MPLPKAFCRYEANGKSFGAERKINLMRLGFLYEHVIGILSACRGGGSFFPCGKSAFNGSGMCRKGRSRIYLEIF